MIRFDDVSFTYAHGRDGLTDISLHIPSGQVVLFCGESGSGKSTITRLVNGLAPHYFEGTVRGTITVDELDVAQSELYDIAPRVGSVFQNPRSQFFTVDTDSEIVFACENLGMAEDEILARKEHAVAQFAIERLMGRSIFDLSGGEKQKVACASVSAHSPDVLVLDEPSSNLDFAAIDDLRRVLLLWKSLGKTILIAEHRLYYLRDVVDRVVCLDGGRIVHDVSAEELSQMPTTQREEMGLRPFSLDSLIETIPPIAAGKSHNASDAVVLRNFDFAYRKNVPTLAIDHCSVPEGRVTAVIGPNGAGKSTLAACLCGLKKNAGSVTVGEQTLAWRKRLANSFMVVQDVNHQLFGESVVEEIILSQPIEDRSAAEDLLDAFGLLELKDRHPLSLSGGEKQRVAIASAFASDRPMIVLDEPTSGLDLRHMREVAEGMRALAKSGRTVIVVTHDPELILTGCDHVLHLDLGSVAANYPLDGLGRLRVLDFFASEASSA